MTGTYSFRSARPTDAAPVAALVERAYEHYVDRIGMLPGPMTADYGHVIAERQVTVAEVGESIAGVLVLAQHDDGLTIENGAVHPSQRGRGLGRALPELAESGLAM